MRLRRPDRSRGSVRPTRRGIALLVAALVTFVMAPILSLPALLQVTSLLLGLLALGAVFASLGQVRVEVERTVDPEVLTPGERGTVTVHVTNRSPLPTLESRWSDGVPRAVTATAGGTLPGLGRRGSRRARVRVRYEVRAARRGRHELGPLRVAVSDPFGLVRREHQHGASTNVLVLPRQTTLWPLAPRGADNDGASRPAPQNVGMGDDDIIARAYLPGDALKRMHWKATAHRGELMVRQEEQQVNPRAAVLVDTRAHTYGSEQDRAGRWDESPAFEWAVGAAASVTAHLVRIGYAVTTGATGSDRVRVLGEGHDTLEDAMIDLAELDPHPSADLEGVDPGERTVFVVLGRVDEARALEWRDALASADTVLAFVAAGSPARALDVLSAARWRCVEYRPGDDMAERWNDLDGSRSLAAS